ncbi:MAG: iron-containing alcohol dehydrogenase, partial [Marinobacter sp.]
GVKLPFTSSFLLPDAAIIDPRMTLTLPAHITAATAMDALTHATEAFTGLAKNPLSDAYATAANRKIGQWLLPVMDNPKNEDGRLELAQASTMAGIAFSNSMVGLVHSLGHATGAVCHLPHGLCMSIYLPCVLEYNLESIREPLGELLLHLEGADIYASTPQERRAEACIAAIRTLRDELHQRCQLPRTLKEAGKVQENQLETIARMAMDDGSILFNPREVTLEDARAVLRRAWA